MFSQVLALALVAVAAAQYAHHPHHYEPVHHDHIIYEDKPQPYSFGYDVKNEYGGGQTRQEEGDGYGNKKGSYGYTDGYGIFRRVDYVADKEGFRATVKTNEPGTDNQDPADVHLYSEVLPVVDTYVAPHPAPAHAHAHAYHPAPTYHVPNVAHKAYHGPYDRHH